MLLRRSQNAGGNHFSDADGQNLRGVKTPFRRGPFVCSGFNGSDDGRRNGKLCHVGRHYFSGAGGFDWICGTARNWADDWTKAAGRIPESGIPVRAWICGRDCRTEKSEKDAVPDFKAAPQKRRLCKFCRRNRFRL